MKKTDEEIKENIKYYSEKIKNTGIPQEKIKLLICKITLQWVLGLIPDRPFKP